MSVPIQEIYGSIKNMGYVTATPQKPLQPSFYKLPDGSILSLLIRISHLVIDPTDRRRIAINSVSDLHVFVDGNRRKPQAESPRQQGSLFVLDDDVKTITLREEFNTYDLSNGDIMSVKSVIGQVRKLDGFSKNGEPIYNVDSQPVIKITQSGDSAKRRTASDQ